MRPDNVIPGWRLFYYMPRTQYILEPEYRAVAKKFGIEFFGPIPKNSSTKTTWRCNAGHEWCVAYGNVVRGSGARCRICTRPNSYRLSGADYVERGKRLGFEYLGPLPKYTTEKTNWRCQNGHTWSACLHYITGCPECVRIQPEQYHKMAKDRGFLWLGPYPGGIAYFTDWMCSKGHFFSDSYRNIIGWPNCPTCTLENKVSLQDYLSLARQKDIVLVGDVPQMSNQKTEWQCSSGHIFYTAYQILRLSKNGNGCIRCRNENMVGASNPSWTGGPLDDCASTIIIAKKLARRRDNFYCQVCLKKNGDDKNSLDVHHIIPRRFSEAELHADPRNLIALCVTHHRQAEWNLMQSIPILRHILSSKYEYDYPSAETDLEYMYEQLVKYPRWQSKNGLDWLSKYPALFL